MFPILQEGRVIAVDIPNRRLTVELPSTQAVQVRMGYHGPADGARVSHRPMPGRGTWGLCAFPYGENRTGIWVCSHYPSFIDAVSTDTDQFMEYDSHFSGAWEMMDGTGQWTKSLPDGTFIQSAESTTKPETFRHTVDPQQNVQLTSFPDSERIPNPPSPRNFMISHGSGTVVQIDPSGNTSITGAKGATCKFAFNGATFTIDTNGGVEVNTAAGQNIKLSAGGDASQFTLVRTDLFLQYINNHKHLGVQAGTGVTGVPSVAATAAGIQSTMQNVSE